LVDFQVTLLQDYGLEEAREELGIVLLNGMRLAKFQHQIEKFTKYWKLLQQNFPSHSEEIFEGHVLYAQAFYQLAKRKQAVGWYLETSLFPTPFELSPDPLPYALKSFEIAKHKRKKT
jgi:hypothetical protein